jgi:hypothetical protein
MNEEFSGLVDHVRDHAGDALQGIVVYRGDDHRDLYRREDVADLHDSALESAVLADIRSDRRRHESEATDHYEGSLRATVRVFDRRVIVDLPRSDESGAVVVLDVTAASNLAEFVADIRGDIYDE